MSDKLTKITLPNQKAFRGLLEWGEQSPKGMIELVRSYATHLRIQAEAIEQASDADFKVDLVKGSHMQRYIKTLQSPQVSHQTHE